MLKVGTLEGSDTARYLITGTNWDSLKKNLPGFVNSTVYRLIVSTVVSELFSHEMLLLTLFEKFMFKVSQHILFFSSPVWILYLETT